MPMKIRRSWFRRNMAVITIHEHQLKAYYMGHHEESLDHTPYMMDAAVVDARITDWLAKQGHLS